MRIDILTLFPTMFCEVLGQSILKIAQEKGLVEFHLHDIRNYADNKHRSVDDRPYGGGPGMVLMPAPIFKAIETVEAEVDRAAKKILLTPQGMTFSQDMAKRLSNEARLMLICGRYEGFDERIRQGIDLMEVSIGDYILSGGEIAAMAIIDSVVRLIPGVLGHPESANEETFSKGLLDYPQYTRPPIFRGMAVPEILLSGNHQEIKKWRRRQAEKRTKERRADLLDT